MKKFLSIFVGVVMVALVASPVMAGPQSVYVDRNLSCTDGVVSNRIQFGDSFTVFVKEIDPGISTIVITDDGELIASFDTDEWLLCEGDKNQDYYRIFISPYDLEGDGGNIPLYLKSNGKPQSFTVTVINVGGNVGSDSFRYGYFAP